MIFKNLTLAVLVFSSAHLYAANYILILGGSGDPEGKTTIFDPALEVMGNSLAKTNWIPQVAFDGGHSETEFLVHTKIKNQSTDEKKFTAETFNTLIDDYKARINSGAINSGDQLIINIDTHGAAKFDKEVSHLIAVNGQNGDKAMGNADTLSGSETMPLDRLQELIQLSTEKGIKLGIIDMSCHSGNTMALKKNAPNTCIVTSTGPVHYGYAGLTSFNGQFWSKVKPGISMEDAFLQARASANDTGVPMISTPTSQDITKNFYDTFTPYLYYKLENADKLNGYLRTHASDQLLCQRESQFQNLLSQIDQLQSAANGDKNGYNGEDLKTLLTIYKTQQDTMLSSLNQMGGAVSENQESFEAPIEYTVSSKSKGKTTSQKVTAEPFTLQLTWKQIAITDPDKIIQAHQQFSQNATLPKAKAEDKAIAEAWKKVKIKRDEILSSYPQMKDMDTASSNLIQQMDDNYALVQKISMQEKKFYSELYRQKQNQTAANDPCRSIVF